MDELVLEVIEFVDDNTWSWRLSDNLGEFLAEHHVRLDPSAVEYEAFTDLDAYLRWRVPPDQGAGKERLLLAQLGRWIAREVFGELLRVIIERAVLAPVILRIRVPPQAPVLYVRPFELVTDSRGQLLVLNRVTLILESASEALHEATPLEHSRQLRMLAVFSLPADEDALALRRERHEIARLVQRLIEMKQLAIHLQIVQYGVTRERLRDILSDEKGWDVVHISGHGLPGGLFLERADGRHDLIGTQHLARLLTVTARGPQLVVLSSCQSAAAAAAVSLQQLGLNARPRSGEVRGATREGLTQLDQGAGMTSTTNVLPLPTMASELAHSLGCAVLAMRFPIDDDFAISFTDELYGGLLEKGETLPRAIQLALRHSASSASQRALATPALFGRRGVNLKLAPSREGTEPTTARGAIPDGIPSRPERFVGRVRPMTRASEVLAPKSASTGVLLHGMAGAGKSTCAIELAHDHAHQFTHLVFHKSTGSLVDFVADLERQLPNTRLVHLTHDAEGLHTLSSRIVEYLGSIPVLLIIDDLEASLDDNADWRDPQWEGVVQALISHGGNSRVILASRLRPRRLDSCIRVEPVHALSSSEAVLLARELPHLRALLDGRAGIEVQKGRLLVRRILSLVQGHPKLIELAEGQAADPVVLAARLDEVEKAWARGCVGLATFFDTGESAAGADDYLRVLEAWTQSTVVGLSEPAANLFNMLCALEEGDRQESVLSIWPEIWQRLGHEGEAPDPTTLLQRIKNQGLLAIEHNDGFTRYVVHPAIVAATRGLGDPKLQAAVDERMANHWGAVVYAASQEELESHKWISYAGRVALPYFIRLNLWRAADELLGSVLAVDGTTATAARILPALERLARVTAGTDDEIFARITMAKANSRLRPPAAEVELRSLSASAEAAGRFDEAADACAHLIDILRRSSRLIEGLTLIDRLARLTYQAGGSEWSGIEVELLRLHLLHLLGRSGEVLDRVQALRPRMAILQLMRTTEGMHPQITLERILAIGAEAADSVGLHRQALDLNDEVLAHKRSRGASALEQARTLFNNYRPLRGLGCIDDARRVLRTCREVFAKAGDFAWTGKAIGALGQIEDDLDHDDAALDLARDAFRFVYLGGITDDVVTTHDQFAYYLERRGAFEEAAAHRLAAALIALYSGSESLDETIPLGVDLAKLPGRWQPPRSFADLCDEVGTVEGVRLADLLAEMPPPHNGGPDEALSEIVRRAQSVSLDELYRVQDHLRVTAPVIAAVVAAAGGDEVAGDWVGQQLTEREEVAKRQRTPEWVTMVDSLRRIIRGERGMDLLDGLDFATEAIVRRVLDILSGRVTLGPEEAMSWQRYLVLQQWEPVLKLVLLAARGDQWARETLEPLLQQIQEDLDLPPLARALRQIVDGRRDRDLLGSLGPMEATIVDAILTTLENKIFYVAGSPAVVPEGFTNESR